jgi:hypothetical protein
LFNKPLLLPNGAQARTLRDADNYTKKLPRSEHDRQEWRFAVHMLIEAAEDRGPMIFARMGMLRAIDRGAEPRRPERRQVKAADRAGRKLARYR